MRNVAKMSLLSVLSALTPLTLMAEKSSACEAGAYVGLEVVAKSTRNTVVSKKDKDAKVSDKVVSDFVGTLAQITNADDEADAYVALVNAAPTENGVTADSGNAVAFVSGDTVYVGPSFNDDEELSDGYTDADVTNVLKQLVDSGVDISGKKLVVYGGRDDVDPTLEAVRTAAKVGVAGAAVASGNQPAIVALAKLAEVDADKVKAHINPTYFGGGALIGYQYPLANGFSIAGEFNFGWVGGRSSLFSRDNGSETVNELNNLIMRGGYYLRPIVWVRYALSQQSTVGLGGGVSFTQQRLSDGIKRDGDKSNSFNVNHTNFCLGAELAAAPATVQNVQAFMRVLYDFSSWKRGIKYYNNSKDENKNDKKGSSTGLDVRAEGLTLAVGVRYVF